MQEFFFAKYYWGPAVQVTQLKIRMINLDFAEAV